MTTFHYPYKSTIAREVADARQQGIEIDEWQKPAIHLNVLFSHLRGPVLEIGGPTAEGYYFLDGVALPSKVIISNIARGTLSYSNDSDIFDKETEVLIDGRHLPYADDSLAMVLALHIPVTDDQRYDKSDDQLSPSYKQYKKLS